MARDLLSTCPENLKARHESKAKKLAEAPKTRSVAIKLKCLECCAWQEAEVRRCQITDCALWGLGGQK
jgi:hypothetical protein